MKIIRNISLIFLLIWTTSCEKHSYQYEQGFEELSLNTELASITVIDNLCYVGGENGDLYILKDGQVEQHIQSNEPRIYGVYGGKDTCFLGIRNKGVTRCCFKPDSSCHLKPDLNKEERRLEYVDKVDSIPQYKQIPNDNGNNKGNNYSPYGFIRYSDSVLTTTSNGLFFFDPNQRQDTLGIVQNSNRAGDPFAYCSPVSFKKKIYIASDSGVVKMDMTAGEPALQRKIYLNGKHIAKLDIDEKEHMLYALAKLGDCDWLYKINLDEDTKVDSCKLPFASFGMVKALGKFYFVSSSSLYVTRDELFSSTREDKFSEIKLPHLVPSDTRNVIAYDKKFQKIRIITNRSVLTFPVINAIGESELIVQTCIDHDTEKLYFLNTENELFVYGDNYKEAKKILQLPQQDIVSSLQIHNDVFYYVANNQKLKKIKNKGISFIWNNHFWCFPSTICTLDKTTVMIVEGDTAYVGLHRDELKKIDLRTGNENNDKITVKPYITRFCKTDNNDIYATSLNDGLINTKTLNKPYRNNHKFLIDYVTTDDTYSLFLNNHYLYYQYKDITKDSINLTGFSRVFFYKNNGVCVSKNGVQFFSINNENNCFDKDKGRFYGYSINPDGCILHKDTLFLATDFGMLKIQLGKDLIESAESLKIPQTEIDLEKIVKVALYIFIIIVILWGIREFLIKKSISKLKDDKEKLEKEKEYIENKLKDTEKSLKNTQKDLLSTIGKKQEVDGQIEKLKEEKGNIENELKETKKSLKDAQGQLDSTLKEKVKTEGQVEEFEKQRKEIEVQLEDYIRERKEYFNYRIGRPCEATDYITDENLKEEICTLKERIDADTIDGNLNSRLQAATERVAVFLIKLIKEQIDKLEKIKDVYCQKYIEASKDAIDEKEETKDTEHLLKIVVENETFLEKVKDIMDTLDIYEAFASQTIVIKGVTDMLSEDIENVRTTLLRGKGQKPFNSLKRRMNLLNTTKSKNMISAYIREKLVFKDKSENKLSAQYLSARLAELSAFLGRKSISNNEMRSLLIRMKKLERHINLMKTLEEIRTKKEGLSNSKEHIKTFFSIIAKDDKETELVEKATSKEVKPKSESKSYYLFAAIMAHPRNNRKYQDYTKFIYGKISRNDKVTTDSEDYKSPMSRLRKLLKDFDAESVAAQGLQGYDEFLLLLLQDFGKKLKD